MQELDNTDVRSPLAGKLLVELMGVQRDYEPGDPREPESFADIGNTPVFRPGEYTFMRIKNLSSEVLNVTALYLQPDRGINQIYENTFDPDQEEILDF